MEFVAPFVVQGRIIIQRTRDKGYERDEKIEGGTETSSQNWLDEICCMSEIRVSR